MFIISVSKTAEFTELLRSLVDRPRINIPAG